MPIGRISGMYRTLIKAHPYKAQAVQTGLLLGLGDVISQALIEPKDAPHDYSRTLRFVVIGTAIGPTIQKWYAVLDKVVGKKHNFRTLVKKITLDQLGMAPLMLGAFLTTITLMEGGGYQDIHKRIKDDYFDILINNYKLWPAVQLITFSLPCHYRVLFVQIVALGWNTYLAWRINYYKT
ncbi:protein Mpv17 [Halyomorpha halys]|uniref:protein Mpv17 n=1 Tax=Halyomorpha halys TaxID=286706 RepID=UPI0006D50629|nr:protein Mpv17 [Halyomorpha halys]XP_014279598.1 protein Mpv17 [Halyomorpha halys]XP_014279599.1 protein Mpv17 [Halyomorpha halys]XP_014279600.1 protein Mpv17 [Halyomorpha halys]